LKFFSSADFIAKKLKKNSIADFIAKNLKNFSTADFIEKMKHSTKITKNLQKWIFGLKKIED